MYCSWSIYARKHFPKDIPVDRVSHVLYAFANITPDTGEIILSDKWADTVSLCTSSQKQIEAIKSIDGLLLTSVK